MVRVRRAVPRIPVMVRFEPDQMALIDQMRGRLTRQHGIQGVCMAATEVVRIMAGGGDHQSAVIATKLNEIAAPEPLRRQRSQSGRSSRSAR
jgi:hypothetical protein